MKGANYWYSAGGLQWELEEAAQELKKTMRRELNALDSAMTIKKAKRPRAYTWTASILGGNSRITGKLLVDDGTMSDDIIRMRAYQKFKRHVEVEPASPGTVSCYHLDSKGERTHVGYFPSSSSGSNLHMPTVMAALERCVAVYVVSDTDAQRELDSVDRRPRGPEYDLAIWDEIGQVAAASEHIHIEISQDVGRSGCDTATDPCAAGCACPMEGEDVALAGTELDL
jgi:hypothetical protein